MEKFLVFSMSFGVLLLATTFFPLTNSWVVYDSRNDMLAMSSEYDKVAIPAASSEEMKQESVLPAMVNDKPDVNNMSDSAEDESKEELKSKVTEKKKKVEPETIKKGGDKIKDEGKESGKEEQPLENGLVMDENSSVENSTTSTTEKVEELE